MYWLHDINPVAVNLFDVVSIHWYGVMYLLGLMAAWWLGRSRVKQGRLPVSLDEYTDFLFYGMLGVVLGGRIGYSLFYAFDDVLADPMFLFRIKEGGMSFHGGLIGVLVASWLWARAKGIHFFDLMDFVAPLVPPGLGFGRLGNFIGGELWGRTTDVSWAMIFPNSLPMAESMENLHTLNAAGQLDVYARHPSQLYQAGLEGLAMFVVLWVFSRKPRPRYAVSGMFALLYGLFRFIVEFVRQPDEHLGFIAFDWLTMGQILSLPLIGVGLFLLWWSCRAPTLPLSVVPAKEADQDDAHGEKTS